MGTVLITGTSHGIGRSTAELFIQKGYQVVGIDRDVAPFYCSAYTHYQVDIRHKDELPNLSPVEYIVNNAGVLYDAEEPMSVNLYGVFNIEDKYVRKSLGTLKAIVNLSSIAAFSGQDEREYCCSKGAVVSYTIYLANALGKHGVRVNCAVPGAGETDMNNLYIQDLDVYNRVAQQNLLGRWGNPEEFAKLIYFACVDATFSTGSVFTADGGELIKNSFVRFKGETRPYDIV